MRGSVDIIMANVARSKIVQIVDKENDTVVTYKIQKNMDKVVVFVTNYHPNIPISSYLDLDDIQAVISKNELNKFCRKAAEQKKWKFNFYLK